MVGANEKKSATEAIDFMRSQDGIFSEQDEAMVNAQILATIPSFDPKLGTVVQPELNAESSPITKALAWADLNTAGMEDSNRYIIEGDALFREENLDIEDAFDGVQDGQTLNDKQKAYFLWRMNNWNRAQIGFVEGRKKGLEQEVAFLPEDIREKLLQEVFSHFDETISLAREIAKRRSGLSFEEMATEMGYQI
jgi:hypothetical protein